MTTGFFFRKNEEKFRMITLLLDVEFSDEHFIFKGSNSGSISVFILIGGKSEDLFDISSSSDSDKSYKKKKKIICLLNEP